MVLKTRKVPMVKATYDEETGIEIVQYEKDEHYLDDSNYTKFKRALPVTVVGLITAIINLHCFFVEHTTRGLTFFCGMMFAYSIGWAVWMFITYFKN